MGDDEYAAIVAALRAVPGVAAADLQADQEGDGPGVLRLALTPGVDEVQVAGDVGRLLSERFGLGVDADRLQLIEDAAVTLPADAGTGRRVALERFRVSRSGLEATVAVTLVLGDRRSDGQWTAAATGAGVQRAAAAAGLRALEGLLPGQVRFELDDVCTVGSGAERVVLVVLTMLTEAGPERLAGTAVVRDDARQACLRAALDAVNRRVERLLSI